MAVFRSSPETFFVEELPAYLPSGAGDHTFLWVEKRGLTTPEAMKRLARTLNVPERDLGYAGMKDRHATTRQWISAPRVDPATFSSLPATFSSEPTPLPATLPGAVPMPGAGSLSVLEAKRHGNKLRVGHLKGNRFEVVLEETGPGEAAVITEVLEELGRTGLPNRYGDQRFGASRDNAAAGLEILRGQRRERDRRRSRLLLSALQSAVFNRALELRQASGGLLRVRTGDVLQKVLSGGMFVCDDVARDQARVDAGEIVPTGPMPGSREMQPPPGSEARTLEDQAEADVGAGPDELAGLGRELPGARRPVVVPVTLGGSPPVAHDGSDTRVRLKFSLSAGSYATVLLQELGARVGQRARVTIETRGGERRL